MPPHSTAAQLVGAAPLPGLLVRSELGHRLMDRVSHLHSIKTAANRENTPVMAAPHGATNVCGVTDKTGAAPGSTARCAANECVCEFSHHHSCNGESSRMVGAAMQKRRQAAGRSTTCCAPRCVRGKPANPSFTHDCGRKSTQTAENGNIQPAKSLGGSVRTWGCGAHRALIRAAR